MSEAELGPGVSAGPEAEQGAGAGAGSEAELGTAAVGAGPERTSGGAVKLVLWRHGQTRWNAERRFQGQSDVRLDAIGDHQAQRAARLLASLRPYAIYSSDLMRAVGTADRLAELTGVAVRLDKDLRERHGGSWEGLTDVEIRTRSPAAYAVSLARRPTDHPQALRPRSRMRRQMPIGAGLGHTGMVVTKPPRSSRLSSRRR